MTFANIVDHFLIFWGANDTEHRNAFYKVLVTVTWVALGALYDGVAAYTSGNPVDWRGVGGAILSGVAVYVLRALRDYLRSQAMPPGQES